MSYPCSEGQRTNLMLKYQWPFYKILPRDCFHHIICFNLIWSLCSTLHSSFWLTIQSIKLIQNIPLSILPHVPDTHTILKSSIVCIYHGNLNSSPSLPFSHKIQHSCQRVKIPLYITALVSLTWKSLCSGKKEITGKEIPGMFVQIGFTSMYLKFISNCD